MENIFEEFTTPKMVLGDLPYKKGFLGILYFIATRKMVFRELSHRK